MKKMNFAFCCMAVFAMSLAICTPSQAQRAIENADEFAQKAEEQAEDGNLRSPSNSNAQMQWDDTTVSGSQQPEQSQQGQQN